LLYARDEPALGDVRDRVSHEGHSLLLVGPPLARARRRGFAALPSGGPPHRGCRAWGPRWGPRRLAPAAGAPHPSDQPHPACPPYPTHLTNLFLCSCDPPSLMRRGPTRGPQRGSRALDPAPGALG